MPTKINSSKTHLNTKPSIRAYAYCLIATLGFASPALAGPGFMVMMVHGHLMRVTPLTEEVTYDNGTRITKDGVVYMHGKKMMLKEGDAITTTGTMMKPGATEAHGG